jgi:hypothetical protein
MLTKRLWRCQSSEILKLPWILLNTNFLKILTLDGKKIVLLVNLEKKKKTLLIILKFSIKVIQGAVQLAHKDRKSLTIYY